jgi:sigma-B regulation protein RsbU (phosphoserine phosphatase)
LSDDLTEDLVDLYETAPCGFASLSPDSKVFKVNGTLASWLGRDPHALIGQPIHELLSFGSRVAYETHLAPLMRMQGHVNEIALDMLAADGSKVPMIGNAAEKRAPDGKHLFTRLTMFKAVDRRAYERGLLEARVKAEAEIDSERKAALLREQFIAVLGHDLRNPLSALAAGIVMIEEREQLTDRGRGVVGEMRGSVGRAMELIDDVLDLARGRLGGGIAIDRRRAALDPFLKQVVAEVRSFAPGHQIEMRFDLPEPVFCDPDRVAQLAANLLSNAVTHGATDRPIVLDASSTDGHMSLSVTNAGEPIPEAVRKQLFQPFFRADGRASRNGLGLGLFIASQIAKAHDGSLEVISNSDETRFTFVMPQVDSVPT